LLTKSFASASTPFLNTLQPVHAPLPSTCQSGTMATY